MEHFIYQGMNGVHWPASINPYKPGTARFRAWLKGWRMARAARRCK